MLFSLFDIKSESYSPIFVARTVDEAKRLVVQTLRTGQDTMITEYPEDFILNVIGSFDNLNDLISKSYPTIICSVSELKKLAFSVQSIPIDTTNTDVIRNDLIEKGSEDCVCQ